MGQKRDILCTTIVLSILFFGSVFEENIIPALEAQLPTTLKITKLTTGGDDTFVFTVTGPTSYNPNINTAGSGSLNDNVVVYHSFDFSQLVTQNAAIKDFFINAGSFGHDADAFGLASNLHFDAEHISPGILGDGASFSQNLNTIILGNWNHEDQWNFLVDDQTEKYSINLWMMRAAGIDPDDLNPGLQGSSVLGTIPIGTSGGGLHNAFNLWIDEDSKARVDLYNDGLEAVSITGGAIDFVPDSTSQSPTMVTFVIDKSGSATIYINGSNPVTEPISGTFTPITGSAGQVDYIDAPLSLSPNQLLQFPNSVYEPTVTEFIIDDLCIVKDYIFSQDDLDALYNNGQGMPCVDVTNSGTSTVEVPYLSQYDKLGSGSLEVFGIDPIPPSDSAIGHIPQTNYGPQTIKNIRLLISASVSTTGVLKAVVLSGITHPDFGPTNQNGDQIIEAVSDSIDFSDPRFVGNDYFVTFNFTDTLLDLNSVDNFIGLNVTGIEEGSLTFQSFTGEVQSGGEPAICMDYSNASALWDTCNSYSPSILGNGGTGIMYEINVQAFNVTNSLINSINFVGNGEGSGGIGMDGPIPVDPGTYSIQETVPAGWNLTNATCNDGFSSFSVDAVSGIVIGPSDNIKCTFENEFTISPDTDGDGIYNVVDILPTTFSDDFSDVSLGGTSSGTITTRGNQILTITEETNPSGVRITADVTGGLLPAVVNACGGISIISLNQGNNIIVTCGSVTIDVINGPVDITFISSGGTQATTSLTAGNSITFEQDTFSFSAPATNTETVVILVNGVNTQVEPGSSVSIPLQVARPDSDPYLRWVNGIGNEPCDDLNTFNCVDEVIRDDNDYIQTIGLGKNNSDKQFYTLSDVSDPLQSDGHVFRYTIREADVGTNLVKLDVILRQGQTVIATFHHENIPNTFTLIEQTLTSAQADSITDYSNLELTLDGNCDSFCGNSPGKREKIQVSWFEFAIMEIP